MPVTIGFPLNSFSQEMLYSFTHCIYVAPFKYMYVQKYFQFNSGYNISCGLFVIRPFVISIFIYVALDEQLI